MKILLSARRQYLALLICLSIVAVALATFYSYQSQQYDKIRATLIEQQRIRQVESTRALADHVGASLDSIVTKLEVVAKSPYAEAGDFSNNRLLTLIEVQKQSINEVATIDFMFINDGDGIRRIHLVPDGINPFTGADFAAREYMTEARATLKPVFSDGYTALDGQYRIAIAHPIVSNGSGEYLGIVGVSVPATQFFEQFVNVQDSSKQFGVVFDSRANILAAPSIELVGKNFFADVVQSRLAENDERLVQDFRNLFEEGIPSVTVDDFDEGSIITTREPIRVRNNIEYFIIISTESSLVYSDINPYLEGETLQGLSMLLAAATGIGTVIFLLVKWNSALNTQVTKRTMQLNDSNRMLQVANEKLMVSEKLQRDFINIAAHELRTPIQPLLGIADMLDAQFLENQQKEGEAENQEVKLTRPEVEIIIRNAKRLERLASDILEVARIESQSLQLNKEQFDINQLTKDAIEDIRTGLSLSPEKKKITFRFFSSEEVIQVKADKMRIFEVVSNLLRNATKFTGDAGSITISIHRVFVNDLQSRRLLGEINNPDTTYLEFSVVDSGIGIDPEVLPKMFSKFTTKSDTGTGLGLYICKSIIEAHDGVISASNNENGIGARVDFVIPTGLGKNQLNEQK